MRIFKIMLLAILSAILLSCATKKQLLEYKEVLEHKSDSIYASIDTLGLTIKDLKAAYSTLYDNLLDNAGLRQDYQLLRDILNLDILLLDIKENPTQRKFEEAKIQIENINSYSKESKNALSAKEWQHYKHMVDNYNELLRLFIFNN